MGNGLGVAFRGPKCFVMYKKHYVQVSRGLEPKHIERQVGLTIKSAHIGSSGE